jgi:uncharacterized protein (UPF0264 family)
VRSADEVAPCLAGGADIIDAKEPARGPLGQVSRETLRAIESRVPPECALSVALGDVGSIDQMDSALEIVGQVVRPAPVYLKVGFAGVTSPQAIGRLIEHTVRVGSPAMVVPVAYADSHRARSASPEALLELTLNSGAAGLLVDTYVKDGKGLLSWFDLPALSHWIENLHGHGLIAAVAGALKPDDLNLLRGIAADVIGVRGAACEGGREGRITADRVVSLRRAISDVTGTVPGGTS